MGTEHPGIEGMHRLFDDALDDVDLTGDVVPGVLAGYERKVKVRRYQAAGAALAVLAAMGATVSALPRGGGAASQSPGSPAKKQGTDYCQHRQWLSMPQRGTVLVGLQEPDPAADQANCEALQTALQTVFPSAHVVPQYNADLALDPRVDQALVKETDAEMTTDPGKGSADAAKYFGAELKYLALHPEDPANVYLPNRYELITPAGRESLGIGLASDTTVPGHPEAFVGLARSNDCGNIPSVLVGKVRCTPVGIAGGWHGALWNTPPGGVDAAKLTAVLTDGRGKSISLWGDGNDWQAWYHEGTYDKGIGVNLPGDTWINRWTGQTYKGAQPPPVHALTEEQWRQFLDSSAFQKFADSYLAYLDKLPALEQPGPSPTRSH